ncbi:AT-hook motif nuclear-localized protein 11 [Raphanus sativus]|nr:AT-hook motif nuclear-localized protein 11 [Raphanus sativus]
MAGSYYIQRGMPGSTPPPPPPQTQPTFHGSQGFHHFSNPNSPFVSNPNLNQVGGGSTAFVSPPLPVESSPADSSAAAPPPPSQSGEKRKRGRPRKYGQEGPVSLALSPSASMSPSSNKRGRGRPPGSGKKQRVASTGELMSSSSGMSFTPHVIVVSIGEDIASKVMSFTQQGPRAICVLSTTGAVSTATILQPSPSHGAIKYEGRFELLSLSISYMDATENDNSNRTGNLSVSLASPDGRVIGGGIVGPLIAASPVQVIVGSFLWAVPKGKIKKRDEASEDVQDTDGLENNDNTAPTSPPPPVPQQGQHLVQTPVGMWSTGSRSMDMHHAHMDIDLMRG